MFLNLASDLIIVSNHTETYILPFHSIDKKLSSTLISLYKKNIPDRVYVLNGPWSFTNVRVGILATQTLQVLAEKHFALYSIDKLTLLYTLYDAKILPRFGIVYFGQRKNLVLLDCKDQSRTIMTYQSLVEYLTTQNEEWCQNDNFFVDYLIGEDFSYFVGHDEALSYDWIDGVLSLRYRDKSCAIGHCFSIQKNLEPFYGIEAVIS